MARVALISHYDDYSDPSPTGLKLEMVEHFRACGHEPAGRPAPDAAEMAGLAYDAQLDRLARGIACLDERFGHKPRTFIPPWNRYDATTLAALVHPGSPLSRRVAPVQSPGC